MTKKLLVLLCVLALAVTVFAACDSGETPETTEPVTTESTDPATEPVDTEEPTDEPATTEEPSTEPVTTEEPSTEPEGPTDPTEPGETTKSGRTARTSRAPSTAPTMKKTTAVTTNPHATLLKKDKVVDLGGWTMKYGTAWRFQTTIDKSTLDDIMWHKRMEQIMEEYNCNIKVTSVYASAQTVKAAVLGNKNLSDVICMLYGDMFMPALGSNQLKCWDEIKDSPINLADARWSPNQLCVSPFNGKLYGMSWPMLAGIPSIRHCVWANKTLLEKNGVNITELYNAVDSKKWNWDLMRSYALACTKDTNADGKNDTWGITGDYGFLFFDFVWSNGGRMITVKDGQITATLNSANNIEAATYIDKLVNTDKVVYFPASYYDQNTWGSESFDSVAFFLEGNTAFCFHEGWNADQNLCPNAKFSYIYLPLPIGPKANDYVMPANLDSCDVMLTTEKDENATKAAIVYNAWARPVNDCLDYREQQEYLMFQKGDTKSLDIWRMTATKSFLDYGVAVPDLYSQFNHSLVSSILWGVWSPTAAIQGLEDAYTSEIGAVFGGAATK